MVVAQAAAEDLADLSGLPRDLFESASIDGASAFQTFIRIVLPLSIPALGLQVADAVVKDLLHLALGFRLELARLRDVGHQVWVSNYNCVGQYTLAGTGELTDKLRLPYTTWALPRSIGASSDASSAGSYSRSAS